MKRQKKEAKRHNDFLNSGFGLIIFTFAFTCLGFKNTQKLALALTVDIKHHPANTIPTLYAQCSRLALGVHV